jgi:hypothetical protein
MSKQTAALIAMAVGAIYRALDVRSAHTTTEMTRTDWMAALVIGWLFLVVVGGLEYLTGGLIR